MIIPMAIVEKKAMINCLCITFWSSRPSGMESPIEPIIKAMAVPKGTPLSTSESNMGRIPTASMYNGIDTNTAMGTARGLDFEI